MSYFTLYTNYVTLKNKNLGKENTSWEETEQVSIHDGSTQHDTLHDTHHDENKIIQFCNTPKNRQEIMDYLGLSDCVNFYTRYLKPLLAEGKITLTIPDKPKSKNQKYVASK